MRQKQSDYMQWAKLQSKARFNLATSGVAAYPLNELPVTIDQLEINGDHTYGYAPLQQAIAKKVRRRPRQRSSRGRHLHGQPSSHGRVNRTRRRSPDRAPRLRTASLHSPISPSPGKAFPAPRRKQFRPGPRRNPSRHHSQNEIDRHHQSPQSHQRPHSRIHPLRSR